MRTIVTLSPAWDRAIFIFHMQALLDGHNFAEAKQSIAEVKQTDGVMMWIGDAVGDKANNKTFINIC